MVEVKPIDEAPAFVAPPSVNRGEHDLLFNRNMPKQPLAKTRNMIPCQWCRAVQRLAPGDDPTCYDRLIDTDRERPATAPHSLFLHESARAGMPTRYRRTICVQRRCDPVDTTDQFALPIIDIEPRDSERTRLRTFSTIRSQRVPRN